LLFDKVIFISITDWPNSYQQSAQKLLQFFIKSFKGKKYKAADSLEQFVSTAGHNEQSLYLFSTYLL
jgi:hypothetical protein